MLIVPCDDGGEEEAVEGVFGDGDGDSEVVGGEQSEPCKMLLGAENSTKGGASQIPHGD